MRCASIAGVLSAAALLPSALAHYNFESLIHNGKTTNAYQYVRRTTNSNSPITDVTSKDIICNAGGIDAAIMSKTETLKVAAGDEVGFKVAASLSHPGPLAVYMSKAPGAAQEYTGDGEWFKVYALTTAEVTAQGVTFAPYANSGIGNFTFTLPKELPAGQYLMRAEHIGLHSAGSAGGAQFYMGCAQLDVSGSGTGSPSPTVKFPGAYKGDEPGILVNMYYPPLTSYTAPGPATWPNACEDHTANFDGHASDGDCTPLKGGQGSSPGGGSKPSSAAPAPTVAPTSAAPAPTASKTATPISSAAQTAVTGVSSASTTAAAAPTNAPGNGNGSTPRPSSRPVCKKRRNVVKN